MKVLDPRERIGEGGLPDNAPRGEPMAEENTPRVFSSRDSAIAMKALLIVGFLSRELLSRDTARSAQYISRLPIARNARYRANHIRAIETTNLRVICAIALSRAGEWSGVCRRL